jgi:hypothetical protein
VASLFDGLAQLATLDAPSGGDDLRDELTRVASDRAVAPSVVIMDATGLEG